MLKFTTVIFVLILPLYLIGQITAESVYQDLSQAILHPGDSLILDYYWLYSCFGPKQGEKAEAEAAIEGILNYLQDHSNSTFEISCHTDCQGDEAYNLALSQRKADSFRRQLIAKGVTKNSLIAKGYGETALMNHCDCQVDCSDEAHKENRRYVLKLLTQG